MAGNSSAVTKWEDMEPRERDAWVAESVMGWRPYWETAPLEGEIWMLPPGKSHAVESEIAPPFTTDASADYLVLQKVREMWACPAAKRNERSLLYMFAEHLHEIQYARKDGCMGNEITPVFYEPGDYSHAAYLALASDAAK